MRSCMEDGRLLHPGRPATKVDAAFLAGALGRWAWRAGQAEELPEGEVWLADWRISGRLFGVVLVARLRRDGT